MYLNSAHVKVFPSAIDRQNFPYSKAFTESNIRKLITSSALWPSAIVSFNNASGTDVRQRTFNSHSTDGLVMELLIDGYYVSIGFTIQELVDNLIPSDATDIYAAIVIDTSNPHFPQIQGKEAEGMFTAVQLVADPTKVEIELGQTTYEVKSIRILTKREIDDKWIAVQSNWKYQLDGGEIVSLP